MKFLKVLLILLFYNNCFAGTIDPGVPDEKYLEYGKQFSCVARVVGEGNYFASAVVINKNTFLTNAHVSKKINKIIVEEGEKFFEFDIKEITPHKDYQKNSYNNDIAIGKIEKDFNLKLYPELYNEKDELGKKVSICGYGATGNFITGKNKSDRKRRAGQNFIHERSEYILYSSVRDLPKTDLEFLICHGDSGGGLFIENKLVGINCFIDTKDGTYNSNYNDNSGYVRISQKIEWIENHR